MQLALAEISTFGRAVEVQFQQDLVVMWDFVDHVRGEDLALPEQDHEVLGRGVMLVFMGVVGGESQRRCVCRNEGQRCNQIQKRVLHKNSFVSMDGKDPSPSAKV